MSITDDDLDGTTAAIAKLEGIEPSGDIGEFNARKLAFGPDKALVGPVAHLAAERIRLTALEWEHFEVRQVGATLGGIVKGLDLSKPLADEVFEELRRAWVDYKVLFFRDQELTADQHLDFARRFGELEVHPFLRNNDERPELVRFAKDADTGGYENGWHHDVTWREVPSKGAILRAIEVPDTGGDTLFCDMNAAYEGLSDEIKDRIEGVVAEHDYMQAFGGTIAGADAEAMREKYPVVEHPVVIHHPISGKPLLYVNRFFTSRIVGTRARRVRRAAGHVVRAGQHVGVPLPTALASELDRDVGQPRRAALRVERLLARRSGHGTRQHHRCPPELLNPQWLRRVRDDIDAAHVRVASDPVADGRRLRSGVPVRSRRSRWLRGADRRRRACRRARTRGRRTSRAEVSAIAGRTRSLQRCR